MQALLSLALLMHPGFHPAQSPVKPYPSSPGLMRPVAVLADTTYFDYEHIEPNRERFFFDVTRAGTRLVAATARGLQAFDISDPSSPVEPYFHGPQLFEEWRHSDKDFFITSVDAEGDLVVVGAEEQGLAVIALDGMRMSLRFQDIGAIIPRQVWATTLPSGEIWAFAADKSAGLFGYEITECVAGPCEPSRINLSSTGTFWVHGTGEYLVSRPSTNRVEIRSIADPQAPALRLAGTTPSFTNQAVIWEDDGLLYLAALGNHKLWVYDVTCAKQVQGCAGLPSYVEYDVPDDSIPGLSRQKFLSLSQDNGRTFIYVGNAITGTVCVEQREYLFEARGQSLEEIPANWAWYYESCRQWSDGVPHAQPPGFNNAIPMRGLVHGNHFYRAAFAFLDAFNLGKPTAIFADGFEDGDIRRWGVQSFQ